SAQPSRRARARYSFGFVSIAVLLDRSGRSEVRAERLVHRYAATSTRLLQAPGRGRRRAAPRRSAAPRRGEATEAERRAPASPSSSHGQLNVPRRAGASVPMLRAALPIWSE